MVRAAEIAPSAFFPAWLQRLRTKESCFAAAYEAVVPEKRAVLKKCAAAARAAWGEVATGPARSLEQGRRGFSLYASSVPRDWILILVEEAVVSPAQVIAAVVPCLLSGAGEVVTARIGGTREDAAAWPEPVLAGLELAGQEEVFALTKRQARRLLAEMDASPDPGAVIVLGQGPHLGAAAPMRQPSLHLTGGDIGIWNDGSCLWDFATLDFAYPEAAIEIWGTGKKGVPARFARCRGTWEAFAARGFAAVFVPDGRVQEALESAGMAFGPGCEGCWIWPGVSARFLRRERLGMGRTE